MSHVNVVFVGYAIALDVHDLAVVDRNDVRPLGTRDFGHVLLVALHAARRDGEPQSRGFGRERIALLVALGQFAQFADGHVELLLLRYFALEGRFLLLGELPDAGAGVAGVAFELLFLGFQFERYRVERPFAAVEQLLLLGDLLRERRDVLQFAFAHRRHFPQVGELAGHVGEVARREDIGQIIVVPVVAIGFAHHFGVLGTVAVQRSAEVSGDAVRAVDLPAQQAGLLLGLFEQLVPRIYLACQTPYALLGGGAALLELRNLPLLGGDFLLQCRDNPLLLFDLAVGLSGGRKGGEQQEKGQYAAFRRLHRICRVTLFLLCFPLSGVRCARRRSPFRGLCASISRP